MASARLMSRPMITYQADSRRRSGAGGRPSARNASRPWHAFLAALTALVLVYAGTALPAAAQTPAPAPAPAPTPAPAPAPSTEPAPKGPDVERFKDWSLQCTQAQADKPSSCFLIHDVFPAEGNVRILQMVVGRFGQDNVLGALFFVPLGIRLPTGLTVQIDQNEPLRLPLERCTTKGCQAQIALADPLLAKFKAGSGGEVTFEDATGRPVAVPFSLQGFTAGLTKLP